MDRIAGIRVFVEVVNLGSLTAAANKLGISKSMATRHIASLEKSFGTKLLYRSSRNLTMTSTGESILPYCRQMLAVNDDITYLTSDTHREPHGTIRLACSVSFGHSYVAPLASSCSILPTGIPVQSAITWLISSGPTSKWTRGSALRVCSSSC